jgi:hypothetical protein
LGLSDFEHEFKSRKNFILPIGLILYLGSNVDGVIIDLGYIIHPKRQTHLSDPKGIEVIKESEKCFGEWRSIF